MAVWSLTESAISHEVNQDYMARRFAEAEQPRGLRQAKREARHLRVSAEDQRNEMCT